MTNHDDTITLNPAIGLANLIGLPTIDLFVGRPLPLGFHILYFNVFGPLSDVGADGHPKRVSSPELLEFPRRMFAGSRMEFTRALRIGDRAHRSEVVIDRKRKDGSTGSLLFQRQTVTISSDSGMCLKELQTIVYRGETQSVPSEQRSKRVAHYSESFLPDEVALFRFSALSGNSHRIHYDVSHATSIEGYPALVVHGPFLALRLLSFAGTLEAVHEITSFEYRAVSPLFLGTEARLCAVVEGATVYLWAERSDGILYLTAEASFKRESEYIGY